ncbi:hypothetical protein PUNSTDRAFT_139463 [Punctularia strigosozonata HHB-11173 SS5]|uniref:CHAT domain-containing protein n=1 Tax=Punctularia strigosozonata (strain HHB-11173) TaxID=741275 RepID=R7S1C0_PUNST|nr:uncharacterized protein PUNSTDRAFT_139463 [Punctularia strigosozonata HHB-11173 SS5]EIN03582.1 hypothetical protein PUNSTDRAFT_139463 [Punctularia strigosozonata HHB-11173 SS5]
MFRTPVINDTELDTKILQWDLYLRWTPYDNPDFHVLRKAAQLTFTRYLKHGSFHDLQDSIVLQERVLDHPSVQNAHSYGSLGALAIALAERWYQISQVEDIQRAISLHEEALDLHVTPDEDRALLLGNLALTLIYQDLSDAQPLRIRRTIFLLREALAISPICNDTAAILNARLGRALERFYSCSEGQMSDLDEAISVCRKAVDLLPAGHVDRPEALMSLSNAIGRKDAKSRGPGAEECRFLYRLTLDEMSPTHPRRVSCLSSLAYLLCIAYDTKRGSRADLDEGLQMCHEAMALLDPAHLIYPAVVGRLGVALSCRFSYFPQNREDLDYSILLHEKAMHADPLSSASRYIHVHNLAHALEIRYNKFKDVADLQRAIELGREALELCPPGHPDHHYSAGVLSLRLILHPSVSISAIDEMVDLFAAILRDEFEPTRTGRSTPLNTTARLFHARFLRSGEPSDWSRCMELFEAATADPYSDYVERFEAAKEWITVTQSSNSTEATMKAYQMAVDISPHRIYPALDLSSQLDNLKREFASVSCDAAGCALALADTLRAATMLEQGRATFWSQRLQLRSSFKGLPQELADRLFESSRKMEEYTDLKRSPSASGEQKLLQQRAQHESFQQLVREVRTYPGYHEFLQPPGNDSLVKAAEKGSLVMLLSSRHYGSFAIIIRHHSSVAEHIPFPSLDFDDLTKMAGSFQHSVRRVREEWRSEAREGHFRLKLDKRRLVPEEEPDIMTRLWTTVAEPIIRRLGLKKCPSYDTRPRIWWCCAGPFASLPIHAAGRAGVNAEYLSDYVLSSYVPTIGCLTQARSYAHSMPLEVKKVLIVAEPEVEGQVPLPNAIAERQIIYNKLREKGVPLSSQPKPLARQRLTDILRDMEDASIVHLACHGRQDPDEPLSSGFVLRDGRLTISDVIRLKLHNTHFAFLAACESASGDREQPDEAIHLGAAMLFMGVKSVVGTLWRASALQSSRAKLMALQVDG